MSRGLLCKAQAAQARLAASVESFSDPLPYLRNNFATFIGNSI